MVIAASALTGILTPFGQQLLPHAIRSMANSSGPWTIIAFAAIYFSGMRGWRAALLGAVSFVTMDLSFYVVFESLGLFYPHHFLAFGALEAGGACRCAVVPACRRAPAPYGTILLSSNGMSP